MWRTNLSDDMEISKSPYADLFYKFLCGEFTMEDFQAIYGQSLGKHFFYRYDNGDGIKSLFRQFTDHNATPLYNLFHIQRDRPGIASYQSFISPGNGDRRVVVLYDATGKERKVVEVADQAVPEVVRDSGYNPIMLAELPEVTVSKETFDSWIEKTN